MLAIGGFDSGVTAPLSEDPLEHIEARFLPGLASAFLLKGLNCVLNIPYDLGRRRFLTAEDVDGTGGNDNDRDQSDRAFQQHQQLGAGR